MIIQFLCRQVTNVCTDTGATNSMGHCDVSFLYDESMFSDNSEVEDKRRIY
ncbi:MAG: hypothetical protein L6V81_03880 [Clostridium sp.]|nr:MAG: hypothetical protein L6V81_03880 [Clostridium sp.]